MSKDVLKMLRTAILEGDTERTASIASELGDTIIDDAVNTAISAVREAGDGFGAGELFLPEMVMAGKAMEAFMTAVRPRLEAVGSGEAMNSGKVVIGTVKGDIHTLGKDIVANMLNGSGFEVIDTGTDVSPMEIIKTAQQAGAQMIALSALMTTSMHYQSEVIQLLNEMNIRDDFWVIVGGGPVTVDYAESIGADGWAPSAAAAVGLCEELMNCGGVSSTVEFVRKEK